MEFVIKRILLTGSSGFIGSRFLKEFKKHYKIIPQKLRDNTLDQIEFSQIDIVLHCAALVHQTNNKENDAYFQINKELTLKLAQRAKQSGVKHFIFLSTAHVFIGPGSFLNNNLKFTATSPCFPADPYGLSKLKAEQELQKLKSDSFKISIIRPPLVYGEGCKGNFVKLVKLIEKFPVLPLKYRQNKRSLIYVGNLTQFIVAVIETEKSGIYLPQDPRPLSTEEICLEICKALNKKRVFFPVNNTCIRLLDSLKKQLARRLFGTLELDSSESNKVLNYHPKFTTAEGLSRTFAQQGIKE